MTYQLSPLILTANLGVSVAMVPILQMNNWRHRELGQLPKFTQTEVEERGFKPRPSDPRACSQ